MRIKYLSLCILGISLSACSTHVIKSNNAIQGQTIQDQAIHGVNALYENSSYDYRGDIQVQLQKSLKQKKSDQKAGLDTDLQKKIDQYLVAQQIKLSATEKQNLYQSIASESQPFSIFSAQGERFGNQFLNDMKLSYDGSVNYRQKLMSFNLNAKYIKPNLKVEARIPSVIDLNNNKFYLNFTALMPYLVAPENQDKYVYYDFSKYKDYLNKVDKKALIEFLKESSSTSYLLAQPEQLSYASVSSDEQKNGVTRKIVLNTSLDEVLLQSKLFATINQRYFLNKVLGLGDKSALEKVLEEKVTASKDTEEASKQENQDTNSSDDADLADLSSQTEDLYLPHDRTFDLEAKKAMYQLQISVQSYLDQEDKNNAKNRGDEEDDDERASSDDADYLTYQQCSDLAKAGKPISYGDALYCDNTFHMNVFNLEQSSIDHHSEKQAELVAIFAQLGSDQLTTAAQFQKIWAEHLSEINQALPNASDRQPFVMTIGLDQQGRIADAIYDLQKVKIDQDNQFALKMNMQVNNYGNATGIDKKALREAKSFKEISKGSFLETILGKYSKDGKEQPTQISWDEQLNKLAQQTYQQTKSYEKTYVAVFIAKLTAQNPNIVKQYSVQDLQEIALVYAYCYADKDAFNPKGAALDRVKALQHKHHLDLYDQFDDDLGQAINTLVLPIWKQDQSVQAVRKIVGDSRSAEDVFALYYADLYTQDNDLDAYERGQMKKTAKVLGHVYVAMHNKRFSENDLKGIENNLDEYIDYSIFIHAYQAMLDAKIK